MLNMISRLKCEQSWRCRSAEKIKLHKWTISLFLRCSNILMAYNFQDGFVNSFVDSFRDNFVEYFRAVSGKDSRMIFWTALRTISGQF